MSFLLTLTLNRPTSEEIRARIPAEQRRGKELAEPGVREAGWTVWSCDTLEVLITY